MPKLLIDGGWIVPMTEGEEVIENGAVGIDNGRISFVGPKEKINELSFTPEKTVDAKGRVDGVSYFVGAPSQ